MVTTPIWQVGIVGCGRIAGLKDRPQSTGPVTTHAQAYHRHPSFHLAAVTSHPQEDAQRFGGIWGVPLVFPSLHEMLTAGNLDVISICSPDECHFSQAREILEAPRQIRALFIEKPVCLKEEELTCLMELSRETGVVVAVNHSRRFDSAHRQAAQLCRSGELGSLIKGRAIYYGGWRHNGVHLIDMLYMLLREEPVIVAAVMAGLNKPEDPDIAVDLRVGEAHIAVESFDEAYYQLFEMELLFQFGRIRFLDFGSQIHIERVQVNDLGERELKPIPDSPLRGLASPLYAAVGALDAQLQGQEVFSALGVDLTAAHATMNLIWQAVKLTVD